MGSGLSLARCLLHAQHYSTTTAAGQVKHLPEEMGPGYEVRHPHTEMLGLVFLIYPWHVYWLESGGRSEGWGRGMMSCRFGRLCNHRAGRLGPPPPSSTP